MQDFNRALMNIDDKLVREAYHSTACFFMNHLAASGGVSDKLKCRSPQAFNLMKMEQPGPAPRDGGESNPPWLHQEQGIVSATRRFYPGFWRCRDYGTN